MSRNEGLSSGTSTQQLVIMFINSDVHASAGTLGRSNSGFFVINCWIISRNIQRIQVSSILQCVLCTYIWRAIVQ